MFLTQRRKNAKLLSLQFGKNETSRAGLNGSTNNDRLARADVRLAMIHNDHGSVGEISYCLVAISPLFYQFQFKLVARGDNRME